MKLKDLLKDMYIPLDGTSTKITLYEGDKYDVTIDEFSDYTEYKFAPETLIISFDRLGFLNGGGDYIFAERLLDREVEAIYPENGEINIALEPFNAVREGVDDE